MKRRLAILALWLLPALAAPASTTYYVATNGNDAAGTAGTNWDTALQTITNAVIKSLAGDLILVSNGTYYATGLGQSYYNTNYIYLNKAITLKSFSGNPEDTILDGNGMTNRLVMIPGAGAGSILDGFTLTNGYTGPWAGGGLMVFTNALITNCIITGCRSDATSSGGGGVYCAGPVTLAWCRVLGNVTPYTYNVANGGGGIYCASNYRYTVVITNCDIGYNVIGAGEGGGICGSRNVLIYNSHIYGNAVVSNAGLVYGGGGVGWNYGGPYLKDCVISNNIQINYTAAGGGGAKNCILDHCWVLNNTSTYGGGVSGGIVSNGTVLADNYGYSGGGGYNVSLAADSFISNNIVTVVYGGAGLRYAGASGIVSNCLILNNTALSGAGGGVSCYYLGIGQVRLENCRIIGNSSYHRSGGGAVYVTERGNDTEIGGTFLAQNCLIANNVSSNGGGFSGGGSRCRLVSCTIVSNRAITSGGGVNSSSTAFTNCVIASNTAAVNPDVTSTNNYWYCCLPSLLLQPGCGNIMSDPAFSNFAAGDFRLTMDSPCKNAGFNQSWMYPARDLDNTNSRIIYGTVDIGCYEYFDPAVLSCMFAAEPYAALAPSTNVFTAAVCGGDPNGIGYFWDFTNTGGEVAGGPVMTNVYAAPGHYSPRLRVTNDLGTAIFTNEYYIKAGPVTYYLATNGAGVRPFTNGYSQGASNIADVMELAILPGDQVLVSTGLYLLANVVTLQTGVVFRSVNNDRAEVTLHGNGVTRCVNLATNAVIEGITLTNDPGIKIPDIMFQNAAVFYSTGGTIRNCVISGGNTRNYGGGYMTGGLVTNCLVAGNRAGQLPTYTNYCGGIGVYLGGTIANCTFVDNQLTNNSPRQNLGGALYLYRGGLVQNCVFRNNSAPYGGAIAMRGSGVVQNCLFVTNQAVFNGGAIYATNEPSLPALSNMIMGCTIVGNTSLTNGGGVFACQKTYVLNSIIVSNFAAVDGTNWYNFGSGMEYHYCDTQPLAGLSGAGNIDGAPAFVDFAAGNFQLGPSSPCINAGTNQTWMETAADLAGRPRIYYGRADMGCYEYYLAVKVDGIPIDRILRINGADKDRIMRIGQ